MMETSDIKTQKEVFSQVNTSNLIDDQYKETFRELSKTCQKKRAKVNLHDEIKVEPKIIPANIEIGLLGNVTLFNSNKRHKTPFQFKEDKNDISIPNSLLHQVPNYEQREIDEMQNLFEDTHKLSNNETVSSFDDQELYNKSLDYLQTPSMNNIDSLDNYGGLNDLLDSNIPGVMDNYCKASDYFIDDSTYFSDMTAFHSGEKLNNMVGLITNVYDLESLNENLERESRNRSYFIESGFPSNTTKLRELEPINYELEQTIEMCKNETIFLMSNKGGSIEFDGNSIPYSPYSKFPQCEDLSNDFACKGNNVEERNNSEYHCDFANYLSDDTIFDIKNLMDPCSLITEENVTILSRDIEESNKQYDDRNDVLSKIIHNKGVEDSKLPFNIQSNHNNYYDDNPNLSIISEIYDPYEKCMVADDLSSTQLEINHLDFSNLHIDNMKEHITLHSILCCNDTQEIDQCDIDCEQSNNSNIQNEEIEASMLSISSQQSFSDDIPVFAMAFGQPDDFVSNICSHERVQPDKLETPMNCIGQNTYCIVPQKIEKQVGKYKSPNSQGPKSPPDTDGICSQENNTTDTSNSIPLGQNKETENETLEKKSDSNFSQRTSLKDKKITEMIFFSQEAITKSQNIPQTKSQLYKDDKNISSINITSESLPVEQNKITTAVLAPEESILKSQNSECNNINNTSNCNDEMFPPMTPFSHLNFELVQNPDNNIQKNVNWKEKTKYVEDTPGCNFLLLHTPVVSDNVSESSDRKSRDMARMADEIRVTNIDTQENPIIPNDPNLFNTKDVTRNIINNWKNPVFTVPKAPVFLLPFRKSPIDILDKALQEKEGIKLDKTVFSNLQLIGQTDHKFLVTISENILILWDQHAVHERIRLEQLLQKNCPVLEPVLKKEISPIEIKLDYHEVNLLHHHKETVLNWGLKLDVGSDGCHILVIEVPQCFSDPISQCKILAKELIEQLLDRRQIVGIPEILLSVLASVACRGAVMFGHPLSKIVSQQLLLDLSECQSPFQCAHGRPALAPILDISLISEDPERTKKQNKK